MAGRLKSDFPILEALQKQQASCYRFHVPAHSTVPGEYWARYDLTELPGLDHLYSPCGCIARAQALAAETFRAGSTYFLINGSSSGLTAAIFALCRSGDTLLLGRNSHRCAAAGLIFSGAKPSFIPVSEGPASIPLNIQSAAVEAALKESADKPRGILITSPNYWGICCNLSEMAALAREWSIPLLVDEAHGGHFIFHRSLPAGAASSGADLWVNSGHKTMGALTPGAYLHLRDGAFIDAKRLEEALAMLQTASPPYPVLLSLDLARGWLESHGQNAFAAALETASWLRREINQFAVFRCLDQDELPAELQLDPLRLTVYWNRLPLTGFQMCELLQRDYGIEVEMSGERYFVALVHPGMPEKAGDALACALSEIEKRFGAGGRSRPSAPYPLPPQRLSPREAVEKGAVQVPLSQAAGMTAAQLLTPFPPGVPVLYPGEEILPELVDRIVEDLRQGVHFQDLSFGLQPLLSVVLERRPQR